MSGSAPVRAQNQDASVSVIARPTQLSVASDPKAFVE